ncbi:MAG: diaminopimelate epimerase [Longimicrobiales bacterium]
MDHSLSLSRRFFKGHGHGNDYLVFEEGCGWPVSSETVKRVCDRWRGPGSDGIVALLAGEGPFKHRRKEDPFRLRMFNPDGSEFERSGNGLRVLGSYLFSRGRVREGEPFPVEVGGERVQMEILGRESGGLVNVAVEMGLARFGMEAVGGGADALGGGRFLPGPAGEDLDIQPVAVGNPHCVVFRGELRQDDLVRLGPFLTGHPVFPNGINVQFAQVVGEGAVEILIWERGVGRTSSSGTSACAVAAACVERGQLSPGKIRVGMEGGDFFVTVSLDGAVRLEGPVRPVLEGELTPEFQKSLF